jgi:hypothetical protein
VFELYGTQASVSPGDFGSWIVPTDGDLASLSSNFTGVTGVEVKHQDQKNELDLSILMSKLWVSAILRDNIVTTFGFVLNRPDNPLPADLYSSLYIIYNFIRLRRIRTIDFLPVVKQMSYSSPQEQFLILFEELHRQIPSYLKGAAAQWVEALSQHQINLNDMIRPGKGPVEVDFLASFESSVLDILEQKTVFKKETIEQSSASIRVAMGPLFSNIFAAIVDSSMQLTQPLFALIVLHLPLDKIVPQKDETERYIVDALRLNSIDNWDSIVGRLEPQDLKDPFKLVRSVLKSIIDEPEIDTQIKQDSAFILPYLKPMSQTFANPLYAIMSEVIGQPSIKFKTLLRHITALEYPEEVVELKDRLLYYIKEGYVDMELVATGFIRYDYVTPNDLLIAMLTRIRHRVPNLSDEILATVKALQQALIFKKLLSSLSPVVPAGFIYVPSLLDAFGNPSLPAKVRELERRIADLLLKETIDWASLIDFIPIEECSSPKQCFVTVATKAIANKLLINSPALVHIKKLLNMVDRLGNTRAGLTDSSLTVPTIATTARGNELLKTTRKPRIKLSEPLRMPKNISAAFATPPPNYTTHTNILVTQSATPLMNITYPTPLPGTNFPPFSVNMFHVPININQREQLLPSTIPFSQEDILMKPLRDFIMRPDLIRVLGPDFQPEKHTTKALLLRAILEKALDAEVVKMNNALYILMKQFLEFLVQQIDTYKPSINYTVLLDALPHARSEEELKYFKILRSFITSTEIQKYIIKFDGMQYQTRGLLLLNLLQYLLTLDEIKCNSELYHSVQYYVDKVYLNGFGAKSVEYIIIRQEVRRRTIDLQSTFRAIKLEKLDKKGQKALRGVYKFFAKEFQPPIHLSNFNFMEYKTKGEWLTAYFRYLLKHAAVSSQAKHDISYILPYVLQTGPGAELVD